MEGKRILLGVTGGIAAYKTTFLIRLLKKLGAEVKVIMTPASCDFVSPLVLSTLSEHPVAIDFWNKKTGEWFNHVDLACWADLYLIAPVTANTLSKLASGGCDNMVLATYLSAKCPVVIAPAMDLDMYAHPTTTANLKRLEQFGNHVVPAEFGELASGLIGQGRMAEPEALVDAVRQVLNPNKILYKDLSILITAGPTYEAIDPVRFIGNHSSGKMGMELAKQSLMMGARVTLILGPSALHYEHPNLTVIPITSANELFEVVQAEWSKHDVGIFAAAVADYKPMNQADQKIKKQTDTLTLELVKNPDSLAWAGAHKSKKQFLVGFALETNQVIEYASEKLTKKNLDAIVANSLSDEGAGFAHDTNQVVVLDKHTKSTIFELSSKQVIAEKILVHLKQLMK